MRLFTLTSLVAGALATVNENLACQTPGTLTDITFANAQLGISNLGGLGGYNENAVATAPDVCGRIPEPSNGRHCETNYPPDTPPVLQFFDVATFQGEQIDLEITNISAYSANNVRQNRVNGDFGQINIEYDSTLRLMFRLTYARTGLPAVITAFNVIFYDYDMGAGPDTTKSVEYSTACGVSTYYTSRNLFRSVVNNARVQPAYEVFEDVDSIAPLSANQATWGGTPREGCVSVRATTVGNEADNPTDATFQNVDPSGTCRDGTDPCQEYTRNQLVDVQRSKSFFVLYEGKSEFELLFGATGINFGRNFLFTGDSAAIPRCPAPSPPPPAAHPSPPPSPPPFPPPFPPHMSARRDPHLVFAHGGHADFKGENGAIYNLVSAKNVSFNAKFVYGDFNLPRKVVHGSYIGAAYWTFRTYCPMCENWGPKRRSRTITVEFNASAKTPNPAIVRESGKPEAHNVFDGAGTWHADNVQVSVHGHGRTVVVSDGRWKFSVSSKEFPNADANPGKFLLHVKVDTLYDADHDVVAPHGLIGQSYDGDDVGIDGAQDDYRNSGEEMTTTAMAEGAIEGAAADYKLPSGFATEFKYSRFNAEKAAPRDLSKLKGKRVPLLAGASGDHTAGAGVTPSMAGGSAQGDDETTADAITRSINRIHPQLGAANVAI